MFAALLVVGGIAGCDSGGSNGEEEDVATAQVRFFHASADAGAITVVANGEGIVSDVSYSSQLTNPTVTEYKEVPIAGTIEVQDGSGTALATADASALEADKKYMVVVGGGVQAGTDAGRDTPQALVLRDDVPDPTGDEASLRVVHTSVNLSEAASPVDVFLVPPDDNTRDENRVGSDVAFGETWPASPAGTFEVRSIPDEGRVLTVPTPEGPLDLPFGTEGQSVPLGRSATYVIIDKAPGSEFPFAAAVHVD